MNIFKFFLKPFQINIIGKVSTRTLGRWYRVETVRPGGKYDC